MNENAIRFLADENLDRDIVVGLQRQVENLDFVRVQDVGLRTASDPAVLQWAADQARVLVTHDAATVPDFAYERMAAGLPMPGVLVVRWTLPVSVAIDELALIAEASAAAEWNKRVVYLPLR